MPMAVDRTLARLASLPHEAQLELLDMLTNLSAETRQVVENFLAERSPLADWARAEDG